MLTAGLGQGWDRSPDLPLPVFIGVCDGLRRLCLESRASHHLGHYRGRHQGQRGRTNWRCLQVNKYIHILWCRGVAGGNSPRWDTRTYLQERRLKEWNGGFEEQEYEVIPLKCPHGIGEGVKWVCSLNVCGFFLSPILHFCMGKCAGACCAAHTCGRVAGSWLCKALIVMQGADTKHRHEALLGASQWWKLK